MTISNGSTFLQVDLDSAHTGALTTIAADASTLPAVWWMNMNFNKLVSSSGTVKGTKTFPIPDSYYLTEIVVSTGSHAGTLTITIDNGALIEDISITHTATSQFQKATRYYAATHPLQLFLKGSDVVVSVSTTATVSTSTIQVMLGFVSYWRRS